LEHSAHDRGIDADHVADEPDIDGFAVHVGVAPARAEEPRVLPRDPHRERFAEVELVDERALDLPGEHHPHDVHRLRGGHAQAAAEFAVDVQAGEHVVDLGAAAVHDDGFEPGVSEEPDVFGERPLKILVDHRVATEFDDDDLLGEVLEPGQRFDERGGLLLRRGVHVEYALVPWMDAWVRSLVQIVASCPPAPRSMRICTSRWAARSTRSRGSCAPPPRQTMIPLIVTSRSSGSKAATSSGTVPTSARIRPQFGSFPKIA